MQVMVTFGRARNTSTAHLIIITDSLVFFETTHDVSKGGDEASIEFQHHMQHTALAGGLVLTAVRTRRELSVLLILRVRSSGLF